MAGEETSFYREKMEQLLKSLPKHGASDLHLQVQSPPRIRLAGKLRELKAPRLNRDTLEDYVRSILTDKRPNSKKTEAWTWPTVSGTRGDLG